jgi:hypothetical protein
MRISTALLLLAATGAVACGGADSVTGDNTGNNGNTDVTTTVNELLGEINSSQNAVSKGSGAGGAADRLPVFGVNLSAYSRSASGLSAGGALFDQAPDNAALCVVDSTKVLWTCPTTIDPQSDTIIVSFQFLDTANVPELHFDTAATAAIRRITDSHVAKTSSLGTSAGVVQVFQVDTQHQDIVLSGIRSGNHQQNGTGHIVHTIYKSATDTAFITAPTTTTGILTGSKVPYPVGGSYTAVVHTVEGKSVSTTTQVTSFDGTSTAKLVISFPSAPGTPRTCTYDMTSTAAPVCTGGPSGPP